MSRDMSSVRHERLSSVMSLLQSKGKATHEEIFEAGNYPSERTFQNDLRYLRDDYGADILYDRANKVYILAQTSSIKLNMDLTNDEAEALAAGIKLAAHFLPHLKNASSSLYEKILAAIPAADAKSGSDIAASAVYAVPCADIDAVLFKNLLDANRANKAVNLRYSASAGDPEEWIVSPYDIYFKNGAWRLAGYNHAKNSLSIFNITRISGLSTSRENYVTPEKAGFSRDDLEKALNIVRGSNKNLIRIRADAGALASYLKNIKLKSGHKIEDTQDGGVIITAEVPYIEEVLNEVLAG